MSISRAKGLIQFIIFLYASLHSYPAVSYNNSVLHFIVSDNSTVNVGYRDVTDSVP